MHRDIWEWLAANAVQLQSLGALATALAVAVGLAAALVAVWQGFQARAAQRESVAFALYHQFLILSLEHVTLADPMLGLELIVSRAVAVAPEDNLHYDAERDEFYAMLNEERRVCPLSAEEMRTFMRYSWYVGILLVSAEEILHRAARWQSKWQIIFRAHIRRHQHFILSDYFSRRSLHKYTRDVQRLIEDVRQEILYERQSTAQMS